ncbi:hypothetical protein HOK021_50060 [Streptomyces hygroscopicus]|nr:hypothetical protein HOK021_50060 [Streptomyces hygroscopicus]
MALDVSLGGDGQDDAGHGCREAADAEAQHAHGREQFGQVGPGGGEQDEPAADDGSAAGQEQRAVDPFADPRRELAGHEPQHGERDEDQPRHEGGQSEAVAGAVRRLRVAGDEREQEVHAAPADEHGDVRPGDRRVPYRPDVDQGRLGSQFGSGPDAEQEYGGDGKAHRHGEVSAPQAPLAGQEQDEEQSTRQDERTGHVHVSGAAFGSCGHGAPRGHEGDDGDEQAEAVGGPQSAELGEQRGQRVADAGSDDGDH